MIFKLSKKSLCKKSLKKHEHTFSHVNHYAEHSSLKYLRKDHVDFFWNNTKNDPKA
jgi:hypothetical protein